jgi:hypothetical protein
VVPAQDDASAACAPAGTTADAMADGGASDNV